MTDLPPGWGGSGETPPFEVELAERPGALERRRSGGLELTPAEKIARRKNRRWLVFIAVVTIIVLVVALIASDKAEKNEPSGPAQAAPAGYKVQNDGYFSYLLPSGWSNNSAETDSTGDVETSGSNGFAAEHIGYRTTPPVIGEAPPASMRAFGIPQPEAYQLTDGHPISVKGAAVAFAYDMTRPGFSASVVDAWMTRSDVEIWLEVRAPAAVASQILGSLAAA